MAEDYGFIASRRRSSIKWGESGVIVWSYCHSKQVRHVQNDLGRNKSIYSLPLNSVLY